MGQGSDITREAIFEAINNKIKNNDPPITKETYDRLRADGHTDEETMKHHWMRIIRGTIRDHER